MLAASSGVQMCATGATGHDRQARARFSAFARTSSGVHAPSSRQQVVESVAARTGDDQNTVIGVQVERLAVDIRVLPAA